MCLGGRAACGCLRVFESLCAFGELECVGGSVCVWRGLCVFGGLHMQGALSVFWGYVCLESCMSLGGSRCILDRMSFGDFRMEGFTCV